MSALAPEMILLGAAAVAIPAGLSVAGSARRHQGPVTLAVATATALLLLAAALAPSATTARVTAALALLPALALPGRRASRTRAALLVAFLPSVAAVLAPIDASDSPLALLGVVALAVRLGAFPFHLWLPMLVEHSPLPVAWLLATTPVVPVLASRWWLPADPAMAAAVAGPLLAIGVAGALYGSSLALVQDTLRRLLGYLAVSQAGALLSVLALGHPHETAGAVLGAMAYGLPMGGLLAIARAVERRTGTDSIGRLQGLVAPAPRMGAAFLLLGLAAVGFPGTLGFVAEDVMLHVVLATHPWAGALLLLATALNAIAVFRAFQKVFLGPLPRDRGLERTPDLLSREQALVAVLAILLLLAGLVPAPLVNLVERSEGHSVALPGVHR